MALDPALEREFDDFDSVIERRSTVYRRWTRREGMSIALFHVLSRLSHRDETGASPSELADDYLIPRQTMTGIVESLSRDGLVTVEPDPADGRRKLLRLSEAGHAYVGRHLGRIHEQEVSAYLSLGEDERAQLGALMRKYVAALEGAVGAD